MLNTNSFRELPTAEDFVSAQTRVGFPIFLLEEKELIQRMIINFSFSFGWISKKKTLCVLNCGDKRDLKDLKDQLILHHTFIQQEINPKRFAQNKQILIRKKINIFQLSFYSLFRECWCCVSENKDFFIFLYFVFPFQPSPVSGWQRKK